MAGTKLAVVCVLKPRKLDVRSTAYGQVVGTEWRGTPKKGMTELDPKYHPLGYSGEWCCGVAGVFRWEGCWVLVKERHPDGNPWLLAMREMKKGAVKKQGVVYPACGVRAGVAVAAGSAVKGSGR